ncbi:WD repeat-containing protein [Spatholobus suberectus]|nr:WD repeat-containing protein [Spatholobus suberectus]
MANDKTVQFMITCSEDSTAHDVMWEGKDIQGTSWNKTNFSREKFRQDRLEHLLKDENVPLFAKPAREECKPTLTGGKYYGFVKYDCCLMATEQCYSDSYNAGMLWSTSRYDVYLATSYKIGHCSASTSKSTTILDLQGHVAPSMEHPGSHMQGFSQTRISAMTVRDKLLIVGGDEGRLICKDLDRPGVSFCFQPTFEPQGKINAIEIYKHYSGGAIHFMASGQDGSVKDYDAETFQFLRDIRFPWPVNHASSSPDGKMLVVVGDDPEGKIVNSETGQTIGSLCGHFGYSCSSAWHPSGGYFATGNQDRTCRIWDVRNLSKSVLALAGKVRPITSLCFTSDGEFMAMGEDVDFVHVYHAKEWFEREQEIDFFGHVSGLSFSPDTESLFIGVSMDTYPTLLMYKRLRPYQF